MVGQNQSYLDVVTHVTTTSHERKEAVVSNVAKLIFDTLDNGLRETGRRRTDALKLLRRENVDTDEVALGSTVLSYLGLGHIHDLARAALDHKEPTLAGRTGLDGGAVSSTRVGRIIIILGVRHLQM